MDSKIGRGIIVVPILPFSLVFGAAGRICQNSLDSVGMVHLTPHFFFVGGSLQSC